jgi:hypothetical protein
MTTDLSNNATKTPFSYAKVSLLSGDQGSGKSNTGTARIIDDAIAHIVAIKRSDDGKEFQARALDKDEKRWVASKGYVVTFDTVKVKTSSQGWRIMQIPPKFIIIPSIHIYCNFHLFGVRYMYLTWPEIIEMLEAEKLADGRLSIDEFHMFGNVRDCMSSLGKVLAKDSYTFRKRHLNVDIMCANERLADFAVRLVVTERRLCSYDSATKMVTNTITGKNYKQPKEISYPAWQYWKYYKTDELFHAPSGQVNKAIAQAR